MHRLFGLFLLVVGLFATGLVQAKTPSTTQPRTPSDHLKSVSIDDVTYSIKNLGVVGTSPQRTTWTHQFLRFGYTRFNAVRGLVKHNGLLVYCHANQLYLTSPNHQVHRRIALDGACLDIKNEKGVLRVMIGPPDISQTQKDTLQRWVIIDSDTPERTKLSIDSFVGRFNIKNYSEWPGLPGSMNTFEGVRQKRGETFFEYKKRINKDPIYRAMMMVAVSRRVQMLKVDSTNPWLLFWQGVHHRILDDHKASKTAFDALSRWKGQHDLDYMIMSNMADGFDSALSDTLFARGLGGLLRAGHVPSFVFSITALAVFWNKPLHKEILSLKDLQRPTNYHATQRRAKRLAAFAPRAEGTYFFWRMMAQSAAFHKKENQQKRYEQFATQAKPYARFSSPDMSIKYLEVWSNLYFSLFFSILLVGLIKLIRVRHTRVDSQAHVLTRMNPFSRWQRFEIVGLLLTIPVGCFALFQFSRAVVVIGLVASLPAGLSTDGFGHKETTQYLLQYDQNEPVIRSALGLGQIQSAAPMAQIEARYRGSTRIIDLNNLGVARFRAGKFTEATSAWKQVLQLSPKNAYAHHNLGTDGGVSEPYLTLLKKYQAADKKVLIMPSDEDRQDMLNLFVQSVRRKRPVLYELKYSIHVLSTEYPSARFIFPVTALLTLLMLILAVVGLFVRDGQQMSQPQRKVDLVLSMLVPGASKYYGPLGFWIGLGMMSLCFGAFFLSSTKGVSTNLYEAIGMPSYSNLFGVQFNEVHLTSLFRTLCQHCYVLFILNALIVFGLHMTLGKKTRDI